MGSGSMSQYVLLILLIISGGYFAGSEIAYASANKIRMKNYADNGDRRAKRSLSIMDDFDKALSTLLIGNNVVHIAAASIATIVATKLWGISGVAYVTIIMTIIIFMFSEMIPKSFAKANSEEFAMAVSWSLSILMKILAPVVWFFTTLSNGVYKFFPQEPQEPTVTEEELYDIIETIEDEGGMDAEKSELVQSAIEFGDITVKDVLTPRVDMVAIDIDDSADEILDKINKYKFSRIPVYEKSIDNIVGVLHVRKYLKQIIKSSQADIRSVMTQPFFVHKTIKIDDLLKKLSRDKLHMAIVTDDYGGTMGIVTMEDILEELVGEIWDEDDIVTETFIKLGGNRYEIKGNLTVEEAFERMGYNNSDDTLKHKTMGAWALGFFNGIPKEGDCFEYNGLQVTVKTIDSQRIIKLVVKNASTDEE